MTTTKQQVLVIEEYTTPEQLEEAVRELTKRCYALPQPKQAFLARTIEDNPETDIEVIALIVLMLENSDSNFNITSPELNRLIADARRSQPTRPSP